MTWERRCYWGILLLAVLLRIGLLGAKWSELTEDRDAYLGIAAAVAAGQGFSSPGTDTPTAFRPPLYPFMLAFPARWWGAWGIAGLQLVVGVLGVACTMGWAREWFSARGMVLAGGIVACDPLLLRYTPQPMTEVTCATLLAGLLWAWARAERRSRDVDGLSRRAWGACFRCWLPVGALLGLTILCRPAFLPVPAVLVCFWGAVLLWSTFRGRQTQAPSANPSETDGHSNHPAWEQILLAVCVGGIGVLLCLPWGIRNASVLGEFKLTTTHGGYTLLLGNNPTFFEAVVRQPLGTTWGDYPADHPLSQPRWLQGVEAELARQGAQTEFERDRAQYRLALGHITADPEMFVRACLLRAVRLWSPWPIGPEASQLPRLLVWAVGGFYGVLYLLAIAGTWRLLRQPGGWTRLAPALAVLLTLFCVHLFYWSNARMRAPVMPILAILATASLPPTKPSATQ